MENLHDQIKAVLRSNVTAQVCLINSSLEQFVKVNNKEAFLIALKEVIEVHGGINKAARKTNINKQHIYKMLSSEGNPSFINISSLLATLGLKLKVESCK